MKNVFKIALLNTLLFGFLQASSAIAIEQKTYLATELESRKFNFRRRRIGSPCLYYHPTPEGAQPGGCRRLF